MYRKLIVLSTLLTFAVIVLGAYVRLSDAGLGCPDWPGCYGKLTPTQAADDIAAAEAARPQGPVTLPKAWKEMLHRYFASTLGILIIIIAAIAWRKRSELQQSPTLAIALVGMVIFQGLLGMWTVTLLLKPAVVTAHLLGGIATLALSTGLALRQFEGGFTARIIAPPSTRRLAVIGFAVLAAQIVLGGWVSANHAGLACADFPLCQGVWVPPMDLSNAFHVVRELGMTAQGDFLSAQALTAIHWMHRVGALATVVVLAALAWRLLLGRDSKALGVVLLIALTLQVLLGIANIYLRLRLPLAVAHNAGAALLTVILVIVNFSLHRADRGGEQRVVKHRRAAAIV